MTKADPRVVAIIVLTIVNAFWGLSFPIMKSLNLVIEQHFSVDANSMTHSLRFASITWMVLLRFSLAFFLFAILFPRALKTATKPEWLAGAAIGAVFFAGLVLQITGLSTIPASRSGFLTSLAVVFTPLAHALLHGKRPTWRVIAGVVLALLGVAILTGLFVWSPNGPAIADDALQVWTVGDSLTTLAAIFFTVQIMLVDRFGQRLNSAALTPGMFAVVALLAGIAFLTVRPWVTTDAWMDWISLSVQGRFSVPVLVLAVFASLLAFSWMNQYQPSITAIQAAVIYTLEPVFAAAWAWVLPAWLSLWCAVDYANEPLTYPLLLGGGFVIVANLLALWPTRRAAPSRS